MRRHSPFTCDVGPSIPVHIEPWSVYLCYWQQIELFLCIGSPCDISILIDTHANVNHVWMNSRRRHRLRYNSRNAMNNVTQCNAINASSTNFIVSFLTCFASKCTPYYVWILPSCARTQNLFLTWRHSVLCDYRDIARNCCSFFVVVLCCFQSGKFFTIYLQSYACMYALNDWSARNNARLIGILAVNVCVVVCVVRLSIKSTQSYRQVATNTHTINFLWWLIEHESEYVDIILFIEMKTMSSFSTFHYLCAEAEHEQRMLSNVFLK